VLQYVASYPNTAITYRASDMCLAVTSDASYLSEPNARSRGAGFFSLGTFDNEEPNGAILVTSTVIASVVKSACDAEIAAIFNNVVTLETLRLLLADLSFPQGTITMWTDNEVADNLFNKRAQPKRSIAMHMRLYYIQDQIEHKFINMNWASGESNRADFFTKLFCPKDHISKRHYYVKESAS
jgi:hypothetical protein